MNKTIIINMNGLIFHIEEDAYEILRSYMTDVKRHFANEEDSAEITTDIENRIAEMFTEILARESRPVVVTTDVTLVISQMGTIEDFETEAEQKSSYTDARFAKNRKFFRDQDDHLLGGVCAGIANYFDIDTVWIRLAFAISACAGGSGAIIYIILWAIIPKAITRADKMAMKGEKLDLKGFVKNFEEEVKNVHHSLSNATVNAQPFVYKVRDFVGDFFEHFRMFLRGAGSVLLKLIGVAILLMCFSLGVCAIIGVTSFVAFGRNLFLFHFPFSLINHSYSDVIAFSTFAVVIIPVLAIILATLRIIFNSKVMGRSTGYTMLIIWIVALSVLGYYGSKVAADFKEEASFSQTISLKTPTKNTYYLKLNDIKFLSKEDSIQLDITDKFKGRVILNDEDDYDNDRENRPQSVNIYIERSDVTQPVLVESFRARGYSKKQALANAMNSSYYFNQKDSVLSFDRTLKVPNNILWRNQEINLTLKVPQNSVLVIDRAMERYVHDVSLWQCNDTNKRDHNAAATFIMTNSGLQCKIDTAVLQPIDPAVDSVVAQ